MASYREGSKYNRLKMEKKFSNSWKSSKQPRKQRKYKANLPLHLKKKLFSVNLSKELRKKYNKRNVTVRPGDKVKVLRGSSKGKLGEISKVDRKNVKVYIAGIEQIKKDGNKVPIAMQPSNLMITELILNDKNRIKSLERRLKKVEEK